MSKSGAQKNTKNKAKHEKFMKIKTSPTNNSLRIFRLSTPRSTSAPDIATNNDKDL